MLQLDTFNQCTFLWVNRSFEEDKNLNITIFPGDESIIIIIMICIYSAQIQHRFSNARYKYKLKN